MYTHDVKRVVILQDVDRRRAGLRVLYCNNNSLLLSKVMNDDNGISSLAGSGSCGGGGLLNIPIGSKCFCFVHCFVLLLAGGVIDLQRVFVHIMCTFLYNNFYILLGYSVY